MDRHFDLVKNGVEHMEKLVFPRFPFTYLTFKTTLPVLPWAAEVVEISRSGMQISLRNGEMHLTEGEFIEGEIHWGPDRIVVKAQVKWTTKINAGIEFEEASALRVAPHLHPESMAKRARPVHTSHLNLELPANLKTWIHADGPFEIFVWTHSDGEVSKFQVINFRDIVQWVDGVGLKTGQVLTKRNLDSPLFSEGEFLCKIDEGVLQDRIGNIRILLGKLSEDMLDSGYREFIERKIAAKV